MDSMEAAKRLVEEFGCNWSDARKAVEVEADVLIEHAKPQRVSYQLAIESSYVAIRDWVRTADEYALKLDWADLAKFQASHRPACVWAVMVGKSKVTA